MAIAHTGLYEIGGAAKPIGERGKVVGEKNLTEMIVTQIVY